MGRCKEVEQHLVTAPHIGIDDPGPQRASTMDCSGGKNGEGRPGWPPKDQLSLFAKRVRRAMRDDTSRHFFGVAAWENDFSGYAEVLRSLEWIEGLARD